MKKSKLQENLLNFFKSNFGILLIYLIFSLILTYPVIFHFYDYVPGDGGDVYQHLWSLWWFKKAIIELKTNPIHTDYMFYPVGINLMFSGISLFNALLSVPLQFFFNLTATYNILFLLSFILAGYGTYLLVFYLTKDKRAAFIAGIIFAFSPYHFVHALGHLNLLTIQWIPFFVLYLIKMLNENKAKYSVLASIFLLLVALSDLHYLLFLSFFTVMFVIYKIIAERKNMNKKSFVNFCFFVLLSFLILFPIILEIFNNSYAFSPAPDYNIITGSADLLSFFVPSFLHPIFGKYVMQIAKGFAAFGYMGEHSIPKLTENTVFIGYTVFLLVLYAVIRIRKNEIKFWAICSIFFFLMSLGPTLIFFGEKTNFQLPYKFIYEIPFVNMVNTPSRFSVILIFSLAVLAGFGIKELLHRRSNLFKANIVFIVILLLIIFEFLSIPYPISKTNFPTFHNDISDKGDFAIIYGSFSAEPAKFLYYQTFYEKKIVNGFASRVPDTEKNLTVQMLSPENIAKYRIKYVVFSKPYELDKLLNIEEDFRKVGSPVYEENLINYRWMAENGTIYLHNLNSENKKITINFDSWISETPTILAIYFQNQYFEVPIVREREFSLSLNLNPGKNILYFHSLNGCFVPNKTSEFSYDTRCLSIAIRTTESIQDFNQQNVKIEFAKGWYGSEKFYEMVALDLENFVHNNKDVYPILEKVKASCE